MYKHNDDYFGKLIKSVRKNKKISPNVLVNGICTIAVLYNVEDGGILPSYLLRDVLIERLGMASEWFECMLTCEEYEEWQHRYLIINALELGDCDKADEYLREYRKKYICYDLDKLKSKFVNNRAQFEHEYLTDDCKSSDRLRVQFYLSMECMIDKACDKIINYHMAAAMTSELYDNGRFDKYRLKQYKLSIEEINLHVECAWCTYKRAVGDGNDVKEKGTSDECRVWKDTVDIIQEFILYIDENYYDNKTKTKIVPKLVVYYCRLNQNVEDVKTLHNMCNLCNYAIELLRNGMRSYYMIELLDIYISLKYKLIKLPGEKRRDDYYIQIKEDIAGMSKWREVLAGEYKKYELPIMMPNDCYIYHSSMAYCINDIIRARRLLLGYSRKQLSDGICAEKTIEKTEQHRSNLQYTNMKQIYGKLNLPCTYQLTDIIAEDEAALRKMERMSICFGGNRPTEALALLDELREEIPGHAYNIQELSRNEILIKRELGFLNAEEAAEGIVDLLELTLPVKYIQNFTNNIDKGYMRNKAINRRAYFTDAEIYCMISLGNCYDVLGEYEMADYYLRLLYEYFTEDIEKTGLYGRINIFQNLVVIYTSMLGNKGLYSESNHVADMMSKMQLQRYRPQKLWWNKYNNLWNDRLKEKDTEKYNTVLRECCILCDIFYCDAEKNIFANKIVSDKK